MEGSYLNPYMGQWKMNEAKSSNKPEQAFASKIASHKGFIITALALSALVLLSTGGALFYFKIHMIAALYLIGTGALLGIGALIATAVTSVKNKKLAKGTSNTTVPHEKIEGAYKVVSWNVGTLTDYSNMCFLKNQASKNIALADSYTELSKQSFSHVLTKDEKTLRSTLFTEAFQSFDHPDFICLQETWQMYPEYYTTILPQGYSYYTHANETKDTDCTIVWNNEKFSFQGYADVRYSADYIASLSSAPDTIALFKDNTNGATICISSMHLRGFSLAYQTLDEKQREEQLKKAQAGDNQAKYNLATMECVKADVYISTGDFNVTSQHCPERLKIFSEFGYEKDLNNDPTIYDANLKMEDGRTPQAVRLDYIYTKGGKGVKVNIENMQLKTTKLSDFRRPSDHLPIGSSISYSKA